MAKIYERSDGVFINAAPLKTYTGVDQLELTAGSATIAGAWAALPEGSLIICAASDFAAVEVPATTGTVEIVKQGTSRGWIEFHGNESSNGDFRMALNSSDAPDGSWAALPGSVRRLNLNAASGISLTYTDAFTDGHVVTISVRCTLPTISAWGSALLFTVPVGYRPLVETAFTVVDQVTREAFDCHVTPAGRVEVFARGKAFSTSNGFCRGSVSFFIGP